MLDDHQRSVVCTFVWNQLHDMLVDRHCVWVSASCLDADSNIWNCLCQSSATLGMKLLEVEKCFIQKPAVLWVIDLANSFSAQLGRFDMCPLHRIWMHKKPFDINSQHQGVPWGQCATNPLAHKDLCPVHPVLTHMVCITLIRIWHKTLISFKKSSSSVQQKIMLWVH